MENNIDALVDRVLISTRGYVDARSNEREQQLTTQLRLANQRIDEALQRIAALERDAKKG